MPSRRRRVASEARTGSVSREEWLAAISDAFADCRDIGHTWRPHTGGWDAASRSWHRVLRCPRCRVERTQVVNAYGHVISNRYAYPDGYLAPAGGEPLSRDTFRLSVLTRKYGEHHGD